MTRHRREPVRPRYGRIGVASVSLAVTGLAVLGGLGALPSAAEESPSSLVLESSSGGGAAQDPAAIGRRASSPESDRRVPTPAGGSEARARAGDAALPADSGEGLRVVFSESRQRVWLVAGDDTVQRTYPVSGSTEDNLDPGTYEVWSRSMDAIGIDGSTMHWFVRFAHGETAAIGFHDIPVDGGEKVQTVGQLGTPLSHGCIRQRTADARSLWAFAPLGTTVVVVP